MPKEIRSDLNKQILKKMNIKNDFVEEERNKKLV